jgi:hypothetical protein
MTEGTPLTPEEFRQLNRDLMEKMLDKAASDSEWKQRLLDDPEAAMMEAGFPEAKKLQEEEAEVSGHILPTIPCVTSFRLGPDMPEC